MIEFIPETGSTNADLAARLRDGEQVAEGSWLVADRQTGGRGRQGRAWIDSAGNFMGSTVIIPRAGDPPLSSLALMAGLAVYDAVTPYLGQPGQLQLKWPNDVLLGSAKLAGILLEREGAAVIVGVGVNLASAPLFADRKVTALAQYGPAPDRDNFAASLGATMAREIVNWRRNGLDRLIGRWQSVAHAVGSRLTVHAADGSTVSGHFSGLDAGGALVLGLADGQACVIHAGDVSLEGK